MLYFKYLEYVLDESSTDEAECHGKAVGGRVAVAIRSLVCSLSLLEFCMIHC